MIIVIQWRFFRTISELKSDGKRGIEYRTDGKININDRDMIEQNWTNAGILLKKEILLLQ